MVNRLVIEAWRYPVKSSQSLNWEDLSWFISELTSLCFFLRAFFCFFFVIWIITLTPGNSKKHVFSFLGKWTLNFLQNWFDQCEINQETKVLILTIGALHLWGGLLKSIMKNRSLGICVYLILSVSVLLCGDNLQFLPCYVSHFPFYFHLCFKSQFSLTFF